ncbi:Succinate-semialdehyde dehydrogenase (NAD), Succinate-semialdehyde dehydrogenase (NADP+) [Methylophaga frappieri]|uniref:Succinate-semialdehyde dehydrogenase (NAD), Succinate-semialdehyde dehydrogenase (NADP+) n=1 Tax=Methylophaga frappieri (strain ATCC BAA-2434 / DSM 25690 / JAM7) TaxID=754477 RepID=I1YFZ2_METFJ|nr:NAD-dependent succinate-semialdehyde dehydrogenase [Methylophaga frappieri]AFJ01835.1 Succinate-semialdehyde dehydrogenase (NAD), Succinate-semialdehyde dehydrogenase (NADP+) [Methylophaga frappieri]
MLVATNPLTGQEMERFPALDKHEMYARIGEAVDAFPAWRDTSYADRAAVLRAIARQLRAEKHEIAELMALEMGKPIKEGVPEVEKAALCAEHYAENAHIYLDSEVLPSDASRSYVCYQPLGTLLGILPWNAPLWLAFRYLAPALMAGNTCVMKHDPHVPQSAQAIANAFIKAGAPDNIMVNLPLETPEVELAIRDPRIAAVSFTGSSGAGKKVAAIAGSEVKPCVLELGGSDPVLVLEDADLAQAADVICLSRIINAGQSCIAAKRVIVAASVYDQFVELVKDRLSRLQLGDPRQSSTDIGPIARADLRQNLHRQVEDTVAAGAKCLLGGYLPDTAGFFYPVTLLTDVTPTMCAFREETFGPIMVLIKADNLDQAMAMANDTEYGLGAGIWTADTALAEQLALQIEAGQVAINGIVKTDPRLPSGGIKGSGYGRELGPHGIREFVNAKQVWIK